MQIFWGGKTSPRPEYYGLCIRFLMKMLSVGASLVLSHITHSLTLRMDSNYVLYIVGSLIVVLIDLKVYRTQ